ncbi:MAG TPA: cytochrome c family protein [Xanthobacteraceae bacterium]|nr:cytochrome c family protein [Xanthobacteraceae bacterium]
MRHLLKTLPLAAALIALAGPVYAQDIADGQKSFNKCRACHTVGENAKNGVGPLLNGIFGRKAGTVDGFKYSDANKNSGIVWDEKNFATYIKDPKAFMPGNRMAFLGIKNDTEIANLTAFLKQYDKDGKKQ